MDVVIVFLSVLGIALEEMKSDLMPINPTIMRVMRVLRIARGESPADAGYAEMRLQMQLFRPSVPVLKLLKMAKGIRALLDTVMQALPQVGNLGLLFFLLFFIFAALGVEMFGRLGNSYSFNLISTGSFVVYANKPEKYLQLHDFLHKTDAP